VGLEVGGEVRAAAVRLLELVLGGHVVLGLLALLHLAREGQLEGDECHAVHEGDQNVGHANADRRLVVLHDAADGALRGCERRVEHVRVHLGRSLVRLLHAEARAQAARLVVGAV